MKFTTLIAICILMMWALVLANKAGAAKVQAYHDCKAAGYSSVECDGGKAAEFYLGKES